MKKTEIEVNGLNYEAKWPILKGDKEDKVIVTYLIENFDLKHKSALSVGRWNKIAKKHNKRLFKEGNLKKEPLLDKAERKYLRNVLAPFKEQVWAIYLQLWPEGCDASLVIVTEMSTMRFPPFEKGTMYANLEIGQKYTPRELGLWKR